MSFDRIDRYKVETDPMVKCTEIWLSAARPRRPRRRATRHRPHSTVLRGADAFIHDIRVQLAIPRFQDYSSYLVDTDLLKNVLSKETNSTVNPLALHNLI